MKDQVIDELKLYKWVANDIFEKFKNWNIENNKKIYDLNLYLYII